MKYCPDLYGCAYLPCYGLAYCFCQHVDSKKVSALSIVFSINIIKVYLMDCIAEVLRKPYFRLYFCCVLSSIKIISYLLQVVVDNFSELTPLICFRHYEVFVLLDYSGCRRSNVRPAPYGLARLRSTTPCRKSAVIQALNLKKIFHKMFRR